MYYRRYFISLFAIIILIIIVIALLVPSGSKVVSPSGTLINYASTNVTARLIIDGPEGSDLNHQSLQITVGKNDVTYQQFSGYQDHLVKSQTYPNNQTAYNVFLHTLYYAGFTDGNKGPKAGSEIGVCAQGYRYIYELVNNGQDIQRFWSTDCGGAHTYNGNATGTINLFENQLPNFSNVSQSFIF